MVCRAVQAATSIEECQVLKQRYPPGQAVQATVVAVDKRKHALDVSLLPGGGGGGGPGAGGGGGGPAPAVGSKVLGRITAVGGDGVRLQLSAHSVGRVALTDIHDAPAQHALAGLQAGQYCRAAVLGADPAAAAAAAAGGSKGSGDQLLLSLRPSVGGQCAAHAAAAKQQQQEEEGASGKGDAAVATVAAAASSLAPGQLQASSLKVGQAVAGYVKSAGAAGVFVCLARNLDARIRWVGGLGRGYVGCVSRGRMGSKGRSR